MGEIYTGTARSWRILLQILKLLQNSLRRHRENLKQIETTNRIRSKRKNTRAKNIASYKYLHTYRKSKRDPPSDLQRITRTRERGRAREKVRARIGE